MLNFFKTIKWSCLLFFAAAFFLPRSLYGSAVFEDHVLDRSTELVSVCAAIQSILSGDSIGNREHSRWHRSNVQFQFDSGPNEARTFAEVCRLVAEKKGGFQEIVNLINQSQGHCERWMEKSGYGIHDCSERRTHALVLMEGLDLLSKSPHCDFKSTQAASAQQKRTPAAHN